MAVFVLTGSGNWQPPSGLTVVEKIVIVAGGGGGGSSWETWGQAAGGGGGGGVVVLENYAVSDATLYAYSVGAGGAGGAAGLEQHGTSGADTVFNGVTALGGGGGGGADTPTDTANGSGIPGGSGGGASHRDPGSGLQPASADGGFGSDGGGAGAFPVFPGGGGGGASAAGTDGTGEAGGSGGEGYTHEGQVYGSGGGAGAGDGTNWGTGGTGGTNAGNGGQGGAEDATDALAGYGGGGGGAGASSTGTGRGGNGGSGTIILVYTEPAFEDWSESIDPLTSRTYYACEITDGILDAIRIPISSWQATVQLDRSSYAQAVIPAALPWVDAVDARSTGEFVIYRGVRYADGSTQEAELARAPLQDVRLDQGPTNATLTISGYRTQDPPANVLSRTLKNVRSRSVGRSLRVRADIDWFLRPGHEATAAGSTFTVAWINYYVNATSEYMDVGEQVL